MGKLLTRGVKEGTRPYSHSHSIHEPRLMQFKCNSIQHSYILEVSSRTLPVRSWLLYNLWRLCRQELELALPSPGLADLDSFTQRSPRSCHKWPCQACQHHRLLVWTHHQVCSLSVFLCFHQPLPFLIMWRKDRVHQLCGNRFDLTILTKVS